MNWDGAGSENLRGGGGGGMTLHLMLMLLQIKTRWKVGY